MTSPMPGFPASANKSLVDRVANLELTLRNMQKTPRQSPVSTDLHLYGDQISTGPRYMASPVSWAAASTSGQLYSQYMGQLPTDMVFSGIRMYTSTANGATASVGLYTGAALNSMSLQATVTPTIANTTVSTSLFTSPISIPRETYIVAALLLNTGSTIPVLGAFSPTGGGLSNLTGAGNGSGCAKFGSTGVSLPSTTDLTTGWNAITNNLWVALV